MEETEGIEGTRREPRRNGNKSKAVKWADSIPNADFGSDTGWRKLLADELVELSSRLKARDDGEKQDPSAAIEPLRKAVAVYVLDTLMLLLGSSKTFPKKLSDELMKRYDLKKDASDLEEAIEWIREAFKTMNSHDPDPSFDVGEQRIAMSEKLGYYLMLRYCLTKDANDLGEAINLAKAAMGLQDAVTPGQIWKLSDRLVARYGLKKEASDLNKAIELIDAFFKVPDSTSQGQSSEEVMEMCKRMWKMRRNCLQERYEVNPRREDLDEAIKAEEQLIALAVCDAMDIPVESSILDRLLQERDKLRKREVSDSNTR